MRRRPLRTLPLISLLLGAPAPAAEFLGQHTWRSGLDPAGGYSALWLDADGTAFVALSDRGNWVEGRLTRDPDGAVDGVAVAAS
ncbi:MAG: esterase-like activity of phytase family protein, partial [Pseudomonadota bacterium]